MIRANRMEIDSDEDGYTLIVYTETDVLNINIQDTVLQFYAEVQKEIRPYVLEAEDARLSMPQPVTNRPVDVYDAIDAGYELDDPKNPHYHYIITGLHDNREGK